MINSRRRLRTLVTILGLSVALATSIFIPAGYFLSVFSNEARELAFSAELKANRLAKYIYANQELWQYQTVRLAELIEVPEANETGHRQRIFDGSGKLVLETGEEPVFPVAARSAPIVVAGSETGRIETAASYIWVLIQTGFVALFSGLLGFGMFFALRMLPLRVIDDTLSALESQTLRFQSALDNMTQGLCMFDAKRKLVVANERFAALFGIPPEKIAPGMTEAELMALSDSADTASRHCCAGTSRNAAWSSRWSSYRSPRKPALSCRSANGSSVLPARRRVAGPRR